MKLISQKPELHSNGIWVMKYQIERGDTLWGQFGAKWFSLYQHPVNQDFRERYPSPDDIDFQNAVLFNVPCVQGNTFEHSAVTVAKRISHSLTPSSQWQLFKVAAISEHKFVGGAIAQVLIRNAISGEVALYFFCGAGGGLGIGLKGAKDLAQLAKYGKTFEELDRMLKKWGYVQKGTEALKLQPAGFLTIDDLRAMGPVEWVKFSSYPKETKFAEFLRRGPPTPTTIDMFQGIGGISEGAAAPIGSVISFEFTGNLYAIAWLGKFFKANLKIAVSGDIGKWYLWGIYMPSTPEETLELFPPKEELPPPPPTAWFEDRPDGTVVVHFTNEQRIDIYSRGGRLTLSALR